MIPILIAFDGAAALVVDDAAAADDEELLLLPPQAAIHSPQMAHSATTVRDRGMRCMFPLSKLVTSSVTFLLLECVVRRSRSCLLHARARRFFRRRDSCALGNRRRLRRGCRRGSCRARK